ncbi:hypothetical protein [Kushneria aurantia]|uniref:Lipoprotein n=1 Tax=Kushneria aurantia TaxID=504092 RepID=A0ABV6G2B5_9GAMM|nr:hypothetical protein [Kushneria aurantia]
MWRSIRVAIIALLALSGCTSMMWSHQQHKIFWVDGFYINRESGQLYVTARDDAFVFDMDASFARVLEMTYDIALDPQFQGFAIDRTNRISGTLHLSPRRDDLSADMLQRLEENGFRNVRGGWRFEQPLQGWRYTIKGEFPMARLDREYPVRVAVPDSYLMSAGKVMATPATVAADAVMTTAGIILILPFYLDAVMSD